jgi:hypothetical protein
VSTAGAKKRHYTEFDCGGPAVCSGCSSYRHGVYEDGSGDSEALAIMRRLQVRHAKADNVQQIVDEMRQHYAGGMGGIFEIVSPMLPAPLVIDVVPDGILWMLKVTCGERVLCDTGMATAVKPDEFLNGLYVFVRACMKTATTPIPKPS